MLSKATSVDREVLRLLDERRSELRDLSGDACQQALQACAYAAQVQKDMRRMLRTLPLNAAQTLRQRPAGNDDLWRAPAGAGHRQPQGA